MSGAGGGRNARSKHALTRRRMRHRAAPTLCSRITAVIPSLPYSRQAETPYKTKFNARRYDSWQARPGTLVANLVGCPRRRAPHAARRSSRRAESGHARLHARVGQLMTAGVNQVITMDLHDVQFQGFFDVPVDNLMAAPLMIRYIKDNIPHFKDAVIVSPDSGGAKRCGAAPVSAHLVAGKRAAPERAHRPVLRVQRSRRGSSATDIAERLSLDFGLVHKERKKLEDVEPEVSFVGDVNGRVRCGGPRFPWALGCGAREGALPCHPARPAPDGCGRRTARGAASVLFFDRSRSSWTTSSTLPARS